MAQKMLMNFSNMLIPIPETYLTQDETDILIEIGKLDNEKYKMTYAERIFYDAAIFES